jgi:hypothetical protein
METLVILLTLVGLSAFTFLFAYTNCKFGVKLYTLLSAEYDSFPTFPIPNIVVRILPRLGDAILKSLFVTELLAIAEEWKFFVAILLAAVLYFLGPLIYRSALMTFSTPLWSKGPSTPLWSKDPREIIVRLWCGLVTASDISVRSGGVLVSVTYALFFLRSGYPL